MLQPVPWERAGSLRFGGRGLGLFPFALVRFGLLLFGGGHALIELVDAAGRIEELLLAREQRMARGTHLNADVFQRRTGGKRMPASAMDVRLREPSGVDLLFHN